MTTKTNTSTFVEGDEVIVAQGIREMRATVVLVEDNDILQVEDNDGLVFRVRSGNCKKACEGCHGSGRVFYNAYQLGGEIADAVEETCRMCEGSGFDE